MGSSKELTRFGSETKATITWARQLRERNVGMG